jgi:hypothetical protein
VVVILELLVPDVVKFELLVQQLYLQEVLCWQAKAF